MGRRQRFEANRVSRGGLFSSSKELFLQVRPEFVNHVVNHTKRDSHRYALESPVDAAIGQRVIEIRQTTRSDQAQLYGDATGRTFTAPGVKKWFANDTSSNARPIRRGIFS